jgi:membrane protein implicated in regulation of membrane protease activity
MSSMWFIAAAVFLIAELMVSGFVFLPISIGSLFAGLTSLISDNQNIQISVFLLFTVLGIYLSVKVFGPKKSESIDNNKFSEGVNKYIGKTFHIDQEIDPYKATNSHVLGDNWLIISNEKRILPGTLVEVIKIDGTKLVVEAKDY